MANKIIMLTGIHGVGKSYIADKIKEQLNIPIYSASNLIKIYNPKSYDDKIVTEIEENQEILIKSIEKNIKDSLFILDSHTCLLAPGNKITNIDMNWFLDMNIIGIIFLYDNPEKIKNRLSERDNLNFELSFLETFQKQENKNSIKLAQLIDVPIIEFKNSDNIDSLINFLNNFYDL